MAIMALAIPLSDMAGSTSSRRGGASAPVYSAQGVRGGEIILKGRRSRFIFIAGLAALTLTALVLGTLSLA